MSRPTRTILLAVVVVAIATAGVVVAFDGAPSNRPAPATDNTTRTITVSGSGEAQAQPDKAVLRVGVEASDSDVTVARDAVAENVSNVTAALTDLGIAEDDIHTVDYRIYQDERRDRPTKEPTASVYRVRHVLSVEMNDTEIVGEAIDVAVDAGATNVHDVEFALSTETRQELKNEALAAAMRDARSQADTIARSAHLEIQGVSAVQTGISRVPRSGYAVEATAGGSGGTDIATGPVAVSAQVTVTYETSW
ncbi:MAG: SIMPL domain-containing protein [Halanaeroarchaeum sp.]